MADRGSHIGCWLGSGGAASLTLVLLTAAALAVIAGNVVPRFQSPPMSLPLQQIRIYPGSKPAISSIESGAPVELGVLFRPTAAGTITGIRFYRLYGDVGPHVATYGRRTASCWRRQVPWLRREAQLPAPVPVSNSLLIASHSRRLAETSRPASFRAAGVPIWASGCSAHCNRDKR